MSYDTFEYQAFFSTVQIKTFPASGGVHSGTGFLVVARLPDPTDGGVVLLVSNKHVFGDPNCRIELTFHRKAQRLADHALDIPSPFDLIPSNLPIPTTPTTTWT
jgi:hypothetical protein